MNPEDSSTPRKKQVDYESPLTIINNISNRLDAEIKRLQQIEEILKQNPHILEQLPELKALIKP